MAAPVIETHRLTKIYGVTPVLREIDFRLAPGRGVFVVGANGAGKSTLMAILAGLIGPTSGDALIFGEDSRRMASRYRKRIALMSHQSMLYPNLTARENLEFYASLYGVRDVVGAAREWLARARLESLADARVRSLSRGMEQRLAAARAMLPEPALLLLDEPFASLDAEGADLVASLIRDASMRGASLMITAHLAPEIEGVSLELFELTAGRLLPVKEEVRRGRFRSLLGR